MFMWDANVTADGQFRTKLGRRNLIRLELHAYDQEKQFLGFCSTTGPFNSDCDLGDVYTRK